MEKTLKNEIASAARDILQPVFMGILKNQDDTLLSRGGSKGLATYDDIERDAFAHAVIHKRKMAVVSYPWQVDPASNALKDKKAAELVKAQLTAINFDKLTMDLLDAVLKGFSVGEVVWNSNGSEIYIERVIPRNQRRFVFDEARQARMLTMQNMLKGEELPSRKFIVHSVGAKDGSPYGLGIGAKLFWPTYFKRQNITFWLAFADKFGSPTVVGRYENATDKDAVLDAITNIAQESAIVVPNGVVLDLLEATRGGAGDFYERMCRYMDEQISVAVLGETMTTMAQAAGLGSSQSDVQNDVRMELARADADLLTGTLQETLVRWIVELNMPGAGIPRVWRKIEAQEDLNARAERDERIKNLGFKPTLDYITEIYGEGWQEAAPEILTNPAPLKPATKTPANNAADAATDFAEGELFADQQQLDDAIELLASDNMQAQMEKLLAPIAQLVNSSTPEQLQSRFAESYAELDTQAMQELMARAFFVAEVWGRLHGD